MKKFLFIFFFLVIITKINTSVVEKVIVKVNNENIMKSEYEKLLNVTLEQLKQLSAKELSEKEIKEIKQKVLDQLIADKLLLQEAKKRNIKVTKREIEEGIKTVKSRFPSDLMFYQELKKENLTEKQFEKKIEEQIMVLKLIDEEIKKNLKEPTEAEAKEIFNKVIKIIEKKEDVKLPEEEKNELKLLAQLVERYFSEQVRVRHILIRVEPDFSKEKKEEALKRAREIKSKIDKGEDFATLAQKYSEDPGSKDRGGDLGFIARGDTVAEFEKVVFSLKEGQVSDVFETKFGYHIAKVIEYRAKRKPDFEQIKEDLLQYVARRNAEKYYEQFVEQLKSKAKIQYFEIIK
ncbi:MAG: peptidylprolyl isomerase [Elusimicrobiota bacterium]|nr:peptidylprolyl isomerase [Endomicrobiia bacterium]MDW8164936.1 peptidylprolyl isomerase [Elusimicrobiota bacterium]